MNRRFFLLLTLWIVGCHSGSKVQIPSKRVPQRVVSLSPAWTEIMYALGLQERLVGVTEHCKYPPEAQQKERIGTIFKPNLERLAVLKPDCILMNTHSPDLETVFQRFGWNPEPLADERVEDVFTAIRYIGKLFQVSEAGETLAVSLEKRLENLRQQTQKRPPIRTLLVVSRNFSSERLEDVYITGRDGLCNPLLEAAGGVNVYEGSSPFPKISAEGILRLKPTVILEIVPDSVRVDFTEKELNRAWRALPGLNAKILHLQESKAALIPGPSMIQWAEKTAEIIKDY